MAVTPPAIPVTWDASLTLAVPAHVPCVAIHVGIFMSSPSRNVARRLAETEGVKQRPTVLQIEIVDEGPAALADYASIPIAYRVDAVLDLTSPSNPGSLLPYDARTLDAPVLKDYDALQGNHPLDWPSRFDVRSWGVLAARTDALRVGGAIIVIRSPDIEMLERRDELALLWDIRVAPAFRNRDIGTALLAAAEEWARARGARVLKVETQDTNVAACRFYASNGFVLRAVHRGAYPELPREAQLLWYKDLI